MASITKRGDTWRVLIRKKGYPPISETFKLKASADKWARDTEAKMDKRVYVVDDKILVASILERYKQNVSTGKPGGRWEQLRLSAFIRDANFVRLTIGQLSYQDLQVWRDERLKVVSPATVQREFSLLSSVFNHAMKEWHVSMIENPCSKVTRPGGIKPRSRRVEAWELQKLQEHFGTDVKMNKQYVPYMFEFAIETGLRLGEMTKLRWVDVNVQERWLYVLPSKNGDDRVVPMTDNAVALLATLRMSARKDLRVFPVSAGATGTEFREACKEIGIVDLHFHDSRHEACSRLSKIYTVMELAKIIGHRDLKSLMVYYNPTGKELADKLGASQSTVARQPQPIEAFDPDVVAAVVAALANAKRTAEQCSGTGSELQPTQQSQVRVS